MAQQSLKASKARVRALSLARFMALALAMRGIVCKAPVKALSLAVLLAQPRHLHSKDWRVVMQAKT